MKSEPTTPASPITGASPSPAAIRADRNTPPGAEVRPPAPFVVGVARSGTTLLRLQLDAHPQLAIPPETSFGTVAANAVAIDGPGSLVDAITELEAWQDLPLAENKLLDLIERVTPWSVADALRAIYRTLAAREGKHRWGDKTPGHVGCMPALAELLPEAHFIHIIRDGRAVAASVLGLPFAPGDGSIEAIADDWRDQIVTGRRAGATLPHYRELRYERLVNEPETALREICEFLDLEFDGSMLRAHEFARRRLEQLPEERSLRGGIATKAERLARHANVMRPPDPALASRWRRLLTPDEIARFESRAGDLLTELGYATVA
jgi:hypothetical protein